MSSLAVFSEIAELIENHTTIFAKISGILGDLLIILGKFGVQN